MGAVSTQQVDDDFTVENEVNVDQADDSVPNKINENNAIRTPGLHIMKKASQSSENQEEIVSMWRCWNCNASENEMEEQCPRCLKILAEYPGDDFYQILVQRKRSSEGNLQGKALPNEQ